MESINSSFEPTRNGRNPAIGAERRSGGSGQPQRNEPTCKEYEAVPNKSNNMKLTLEFDSEKEGTYFPILAARADGVHELFRDLIFQLDIWSKENVGDEQSKAFTQACDWVMEELSKRGLVFESARQGKRRNRAGEIVWQRTDLALHPIKAATTGTEAK